jgi:hypothetical protein
VGPILRRITEAGGDARAVIAELGLPDDAMEAPEVVVPLEVQERLYARAAEVCYPPSSTNPWGHVARG